jgi:hypothetical protein
MTRVTTNNQPHKKRTVLRICEECEKEFYALLQSVKKGYGKCCSRSCGAIRRNRIKGNDIGRKNPERQAMIQRNYDRKKKYNILPEAWEALYVEQKSMCAICGVSIYRPGPGIAKNDKAHTDHNHTTEKVRGLLCGDCNYLLGYAKDKPTILCSAIRYLSRYEGYGYDLLETAMEG